ncbi:unnamed protein product, partial [Polarella glacialis]
LRANARQVCLHLALVSLIGFVLKLVLLPEAILAKKRAAGGGAGNGVSFLIFFGCAKSLAGLAAGVSADCLGRKRACVIGWMFGLALLPAVVLGTETSSWMAFRAADALLGVQQGLTWGLNIICLMDLLGPEGRGMASGMSNAMGYLASAAAAPPAAALAGDAYGEREICALLGVCVFLGMGLVCISKDTAPWVRLEQRGARNVLDLTPGLPILDMSHKPTQQSLFVSMSGCGSKAAAACALGGLTVNAATALIWGPLVPWCREQGSISLPAIGFIESAHSVAKVLGMLVGGLLVDRCSPRPVAVTAMTLLVAGLGLVVSITRGKPTEADLLMASGAVGLAVGLAFPALAVASCNAAPTAHRAAAYGGYRMWRDFGYAAGGILSNFWIGGAEDAGSGLRSATLGVALLSISAALALALALPPACGSSSSSARESEAVQLVDANSSWGSSSAVHGDNLWRQLPES